MKRPPRGTPTGELIAAITPYAFTGNVQGSDVGCVLSRALKAYDDAPDLEPEEQERMLALVSAWHRSEVDEQPLHEFLGLTREQYACWVETGRLPVPESEGWPPPSDPFWHATVSEEAVPAAEKILAARNIKPEPDPGALRRLVAEQAEDDGLWFVAATAPEAYLQQELRRLHAAIEAVPVGITAWRCFTCDGRAGRVVATSYAMELHSSARHDVRRVRITDDPEDGNNDG